MEQVDEERRNYLLKPKPLSKSHWLIHRRVPKISDKMLIKKWFFIYFCKFGHGIYLYMSTDFAFPSSPNRLVLLDFSSMDSRDSLFCLFQVDTNALFEGQV